MAIYGHGTVGRNITVTHCNGQRLSEARSPDDLWEDFSIDFLGTYTCERATKQARRVTGDKTIIINNVEHETHFYKMKVSEFLRHAERTN